MTYYIPVKHGWKMTVRTDNPGWEESIFRVFREHGRSEFIASYWVNAVKVWKGQKSK